MMPRRRTDKGFTLIELLVVIIIIGILAAIAIPAFLNQRQKGFDAQVVESVRSMAVAVINEDEGSGITRPWDQSKKEALYVDQDSGLRPAGTLLWNDVPEVQQVTVSKGVLVEAVHVTVPNASWVKGHQPDDFCIVGRSQDSGKYNYPGTTGLLFGKQAYYDQKLGGIVPFEQIVRAYQSGNITSCHGYAQRFLTLGGTL